MNASSIRGGPKLSVAYLALTTHWGGASTSLWLLLRSLADRGVERTVVVGESAPDSLEGRLRAASDHFEVTPLPALHHHAASLAGQAGLRRALREGRAAAARVGALLRRQAPAILHVNTTVLAPLLGPLRDLLPDTRVVLHARELIPPPAGDPVAAWMLGELRRRSDAVLAISDNEAARFEGHPGLKVLPNPVDLAAALVPRGALRHQLGLDDATPLVGMLAQLDPTKGHLDFLRMAQLVAERRPDARFLVFGVPRRPWWRRVAGRLLRPRGYSLQVERAAARPGVRERVRLLPPTHDVWQALADLDVVVRPSTSGDPWGRDIIEAMAAARPVVATGSSSFYVVEGETGHLVPPGRPAAVAERVLALCDDPALRAQLGAAGRRRVEERCDLRAYGARVMAVYEELVGATAREPR